VEEGNTVLLKYAFLIPVILLRLAGGRVESYVDVSVVEVGMCFNILSDGLILLRWLRHLIYLFLSRASP